MADIKNHSTLTTNLVSYWELEEASGTRVDSHGANDLSESGTGGVGQVSGAQGNAADFEAGDSDYLSITDASQSGLDLTGDVSVSFWITPESQPATNSQYSIVSKYNSATANRSYDFAYRDVSSTKYFRFVSTTTGSTNFNILDVAYTMSNATTYHVVMTFDASAATMELWVNGSSQGTATGSFTSIYNGSSDFRISGLGNSTSFFDGVLDEVGIWSKVLTSSEISDLYNSGTPLEYETLSSGRRVFLIT